MYNIQYTTLSLISEIEPTHILINTFAYFYVVFMCLKRLDGRVAPNSELLLNVTKVGVANG